MRLLASLAAGAAALAALAVGCATGDAQSYRPAVLDIDAAPVEVDPDELDGLALRGAVELSAPHPAFGGISGMLIDGATLLAVTDGGWLIRSPLADDGAGLRPVGGDIAPLRNQRGFPLDHAGSDAEALAIAEGGALAVAFERDHRVDILSGDRPERTIADRRFEALGFNEGLEALATLPDGRLLAIAEEPAGGAFPAFVLDGTDIAAGALPQSGPHFVTGADVGPDGRLYLLRRDFSVLTGLSIRIERYRLGRDGFPLPETHETLAVFGTVSGIDNMEAIALWRDRGGRTRLAIASDDNFSVLQRTLLLDFEVLN